MNFEPLPVEGAYLIRPERLNDERGFFMRTFCDSTFIANGLNAEIGQCSASFNTNKHTLRGMHYQVSPHEETKFVRCTQGAAHHTLLDLRNSSATYLDWTAVELNSENRHMLYVPAGVAHGFITLADATEIFYQISEPYAPECARGVRWDDPVLNIDWPATPIVISKRDAAYPDFREQD